MVWIKRDLAWVSLLALSLSNYVTMNKSFQLAGSSLSHFLKMGLIIPNELLGI